MTTTTKVLFEAKDAETVLTAQYTTPASTRTQVDKLTATNTTGASITVDVHLVPSGGAAGVTNKLISAKAITAGADETLQSLIGHTLSAGGSIWLKASAPGLTIRATGRETT